MSADFFGKTAVDNRLRLLVKAEEQRQTDCVNLIASENFCSPAVLKLAGTVLTNKYSEGYPHARYYRGCQFIDEIEELAQNRLRNLFDCGCSATNVNCRRANDYVNVQPYSGSTANAAVYLALLKPGEVILSMSLKAGGHLTHGARVNFSGYYFTSVTYGVHPVTMRLDYDEIERLAIKHRPRIIIAGFSAYAFIIDWGRFRVIADRVGAWLWCDVAHLAGLIVARQHPNPVCVADVITFTTHKTLRGPRGGVIMATTALAAKIARGLFPGTQGGPQNHIIAAKIQAFQEAAQPAFELYQQRVVQNCRAMCRTLQTAGFDTVGGLSENHLFLVNTVNSPSRLTGSVAVERLAQINIIANKNMMPNDAHSPKVTSGVRFGSAAMTTRNWTATEFVKIANIIIQTWLLNETKFQQQKLLLQQQVARLLATAGTKFYQPSDLIL